MGKKFILTTEADIDDVFDRTTDEIYRLMIPRLNKGLMELRDGLTINFTKAHVIEKENANFD